MNTRAWDSKSASNGSRVSLWIDAVGGYRLLSGERFTIGGVGGNPRADIAVRCAWSSRQATIHRVEDDMWLTLGTSDAAQPTLVRFGVPLALPSEASGQSMSPKLTLHKPSSLSHTVVVDLSAPYRFADPIDGVILMDSTLLIGPSHEHHIRVPRLNQQYVLTMVGDQFGLRAAGRSHALQFAVPLELDELTITLRNDNNA